MDKDVLFKSVKRGSNLKLEEDDRVIPFNPSMFSPKEGGDITGRGPANASPLVAVAKT